MITLKDYVRAQSLEEAYQLNQKKNNRIVGGMLWTKMQSRDLGTAIDLCDLGLNTITETEDDFSIGAMVTLRQLELHCGLNEYCQGAVKDAVKDIIGVQFRNLATIGGSLWGRYGFSDLLTVFLALDTYVELYKGGIIPLEEFAHMKKDNDILVRILVMKTPGKFLYRSVRIQRTDFPVLTCATSLMNGVYRTVIGARPEKAEVVYDKEDILANGITEASAAAFADYAAAALSTASNSRGSAEYRTHLIRVLTARNLMELGGGQ